MAVLNLLSALGGLVSACRANELEPSSVKITRFHIPAIPLLPGGSDGRLKNAGGSDIHLGATFLAVFDGP